ncbi:conidiation-specific 6 [Pyrrhoderma noxium]|uniref:Conidiation-specific 6 n=1 Tax=Pyrrhoderma noxium TaxID=2282107 RepID=A0A286US41_9AGAM|nr:conidiation-specific 6 [Pyrrhoderma noxium]
MAANIGNVAGGHKANIANPKTSNEAKEHSRQILDDLDSSGELQENASARDTDKNTGNVFGGHKATLKNPNVSEEAKQNSRQFLEENDAI